MSIWKEINEKATKNLKKRWYIIIPIFLLVIGSGSYSIVDKASCVWFNDQSNYFSANVFYFDGLKPICQTLESYDQEFFNGDLFNCLYERGDYKDPFKCQEKSEPLGLEYINIIGEKTNENKQN